MKFTFKIVFISLIFSSCETHWGKYGGYKMEYDSAMDYYIILDKIDTVLENYPYYNKGSFIKYYRNNSVIDTVFIGNEGKIIGSFVDADKTNFNDKFILVAQIPLDSICECNDSCYKKSSLEDNKSYERCKDALEKSTFYRYWIINKKKNSIYGPLKKNEYIEKRKELGVPSELNLKE